MHHWLTRTPLSVGTWPLLLFATVLATLPTCGRAADKPNVVLILADDLGAIDLNCFGTHDLKTPNIDRLAAQGTKFTQFYSVAPVCASSRGSLMTGRYPDQCGIVHNGQSLNEGETTIAQVLGSAGYQTGLVGKWHVGMKWGGPNGQGFDHFFGFRHGCIENWQHNTLNWDTGKVVAHDLWHNNEPITRAGEHFGELIASESTDFIRQHQDEPFFLYVAFNNPHYPVQPLQKHLDHYADLEEPRRHYAAFVSTMDDEIGRIVETIDQLGLRERTLILFLSDHGCSHEKRNGLFVDVPEGKPPYGGSSGPYRGSKFTVWEGGVRVPMIASWPGTIAQGESRDQVAANIDLFPTIVQYTGAELPANPLAGKPLQNILEHPDAPTEHPTLRYVAERNTLWGIRHGRWKLVSEQGKPFLSDMQTDTSETRNLADQHPEIVAELESLHEELKGN